MEYPLIRKWGEGVTSSSEISALEKRRVSLIIISNLNLLNDMVLITKLWGI
jgi:hypothetical protein